MAPPPRSPSASPGGGDPRPEEPAGSAPSTDGGTGNGIPGGPAGALRHRIAERFDERDSYSKWVLWVALIGMFATTFPITVLTLAIPAMARDFDVPETTLAWVIILPTILSALALPVLGKLGDLYGHRRVFIIGFLVATVATGLTATAWSAATLIAWRTATQVVGAATQPSSLALINASYPPEQRSKAMGWWAMVAAGAPVIGLVVGGPLIDAMGWQVLFLVQAGLMVIPAGASWLVLRETPRRVARFDLAGAFTLAVGVGALMVALSRGPEWGMTSPPVLAALVLAPVALVAFVRIERRVPSPLLPLDFFARRDFSAPVVVSFFASGSYMGGYFLATLMIVGLFGISATDAAMILAIRPLLFALSSPPGGWLAGRIGNRNGAVAGCLALAAGMVGLALGAAIESLVVVVAVGFVFQGIGFGLLRPPVSTALANAVDNEDLGIAGASERLMGQLGFAFGVTLLTTVYADTPTPERFSLGFAVGAVLALLAALVAALMRPGRVADQQIGTLVDGLVEELAEEESADSVPLDRSGRGPAAGT